MKENNIVMNLTPVIIEKTIDAPASIIWEALTDKSKMKEWYFDLAAFNPEPGFEFRFYGEGKEGEKYLHRCTVQEVIVPEKLSYTWQYEGYEGNSLVCFELFPDGDRTRLKLTHSGLETFPSTTRAFAKENFIEGWTMLIGTQLPAYLARTRP